MKTYDIFHNKTLSPKETFFVKFETEKEIETFNKQLESENLPWPLDANTTNKKLFYYDEVYNDWINVETEIEKINNLIPPQVGKFVFKEC